MKRIAVEITFLDDPEDPGAFSKADARMIWDALCRAFPLCRMSAIHVREIGTITSNVSTRVTAEEMLAAYGGDRARLEAAVDHDIEAAEELRELGRLDDAAASLRDGVLKMRALLLRELGTLPTEPDVVID